MNTHLFCVMRMFIFAAIAFSAVTIKVQAVVGQTDAVTRGDFTLARFDRVIAKFNDLATVEADQVIVVLLLGQFEDRFTTFEIMTGDNARVIKLVQHAIDGSQPKSQAKYAYKNGVSPTNLLGGKPHFIRETLYRSGRKS